MLKKNLHVTTAFEEYIIIDQIGQGGNGTVYKAIDSQGKIVAIKAIDRNHTTSEKLKRFKNEISFCQNNAHPNIIKVIDYGTYNDNTQNIVFYVMPFYDHTLRTEMNAGIDEKRIFEIFTQLLEGIDFAHSKGVWHRDIKPENILIDARTNQVVIADFGIAHFGQDLIITSIETKVADKLANFVYAAPEQRVRNKVVDGNCDIFSLGLILNEMFTGEVISGTNYKTVSSVNRNCGFIDTIIEAMIAQSPQNRPYPSHIISYQLKSLIKEKQISTELEQLINKKIEREDEFNYECPKIIDMEYKDGVLKLYLDKVTPTNWNNILLSDSYSRESVMGYGPERFHFSNEMGHTTFFIQIRGENPDTVSMIVRDFKNWINTATKMYITDETEERKQERIRKEQEMQKLIRQKENEKSINNSLKALLG